jgi:carbonic anhydrase/acetyltransferase-like protein (isoleucine patch superfamily)
MQNRILPGSCLEDLVFLGAGATILEKIKIGRGSVIAANSTVIKDVPERVFYYEEKIGKTKMIPEGIYYPLTEREKLEREV